MLNRKAVENWKRPPDKLPTAIYDPISKDNKTLIVSPIDISRKRRKKNKSKEKQI